MQDLLQRSQLYSHTPSALNAGAKRTSDVPFGQASMLLFGEGSEATEPYNKYVLYGPQLFKLSSNKCPLVAIELYRSLSKTGGTFS